MLGTLKFLCNFLTLVVIGLIKAILPARILPKKDVSHQIVLITGSGHGLGRLFAVEFAKLGSRLVLWDKNVALNNETKQIVEEIGADVHAYEVDLANKEDIEKCVERVKAEVGQVNILINNAGIVNEKGFFELTYEEIDRIIDVNLMAVLQLSKAFMPYMIESNSGHLVIMASIAGICPGPGLVDYCTTKFGAVGFSEAIMSEMKALKKDNVHVTCICPYFINTGMFSGIDKSLNPLFPILEQNYVISRSMKAILTNQKILILPKSAYVLSLLKSFLPIDVTLSVVEWLGIASAMQNFQRAKTA